MVGFLATLRSTESSNPSPSSGQSVSLPHAGTNPENPGFTRERAGHGRWCGHGKGGVAISSRSRRSPAALLGRGMDVPMPVILVGAPGSMAADGIIGSSSTQPCWPSPGNLPLGGSTRTPTQTVPRVSATPRVLPWRPRLLRADRLRRAQCHHAPWPMPVCRHPSPHRSRSGDGTGEALIYTALLLVCGMADNVLKPLMRAVLKSKPSVQDRRQGWSG
jgi:hypothetical protein